MKRTVRPEAAKYHIQEFLGEGSMAFVYKALRIDSRGFSSQPVAIKVLKSQTQIPHLIQEMQALMGVRSAHCVSLLGWENLPEGPSLVMEWVEGISLDGLARLGPLSSELITEIVAQVQAGLSDLERAGRCHGDLSPSNVLVDMTGTVKLVDFGVSGQQPPGQITGTARFMAPERWQGAPPSIKSDLFSLGLLAHDLAANRLSDSASASFWRNRAETLAGSDQTLLTSMPAHRAFAPAASLPERREQLAHLVAQARDQKQQMARTLAHGLERRQIAARWVHVLSLAMLAVVTIYPIAPFGESAQFRPQPSASIEVRTHSWIRLRLGFIDLGYAPLSHDSLPPGLHRIYWTSKL
ncbi:MAG TPA: serine/threonine-protein kinase, partial [Bdellovibrionales bacterium]|nr:serine/threonine-protein kinase [Bdellovibrionales bacterium]